MINYDLNMVMHWVGYNCGYTYSKFMIIIPDAVQETTPILRLKKIKPNVV